jgi:hypothetical protein
MYVRRRSPLGIIGGLIVIGVLVAVVIPKIKGALKTSGQVDAQARRLSLLSEGKLGSSYFITRAAGFTVNTVTPVLAPEEVTLDDPGPPGPHAFSLALVRAPVPAELMRAIRRRPGLSDFAPDSISLARSDIDRRVVWTVTGAGGGHELVFTARPDGSRLTRRA